MSDVTRLLEAVQAGDRQAANQLLPIVYNELRKLAAAKMALESSGHTLNATALVHEAYLRLIGDQKFDGQGHFFAAAAEAMRRILINRARDKQRLKRRGIRERFDLNAFSDPANVPDLDLLDLDDALERLAGIHPQAAELIKLKFFAGLIIPEIATTLGLSVRSANRLWAFARAWLLDALDPH